MKKKDFYFLMGIHDSFNSLTHMLNDIKNGNFPIDRGLDLIIEKSEKKRCLILDYLMKKEMANQEESE